MSVADDWLSNSLVLTALLCGVIFGFGFTILVLHANDCRVFDAQGKYIPGPLTNLWGKNLINVLTCARKAKNVSFATCEELLYELGNGDIAAFNSIFGRQTVVVGHPELIKSVLSGHHMKFIKTAHINRLKFFLGEGLFTSEGARWQAHRQLIGSGFQSENIKSMIPNFNLQTQRIVKYWMSNIGKLRKVDPRANSIPVNLKNDFHNLSMSIMCCSAFSYDFQSSENRDTISAAFEVISSELNERNNDPYDWWHLLFPTRTGSTKSALEVFHPFLEEIISARLVEYTNSLNRRTKRRAAQLTNNNNSNSNSMDSNSMDEDPPAVHTIDIAQSKTDEVLININHSNTTSSASIIPPDLSSFMYNPSEKHSINNTPSNKPPLSGPNTAHNRSSNTVTSPMRTDTTTSKTYTNTTTTATTNSTTGTNSNPTKPNKPSRGRDLLDLLIQCGSDSNDTTNKFSRTEIRDHLYTFLTTGHETTCACLQWTVYELCKHPNIQLKCQQEIDSLFAGMEGTAADLPATVAAATTDALHSNSHSGSTNANTGSSTNPTNTNTNPKKASRSMLPLTFADINKLNYLVQVLKESMRLHTINGNIVRECNSECNVGPYKLKKGTIVMVSAVAAHMHPEFWEDPTLFKPERFSKEFIRHTVKHPYQYIPFSAGPRSCIGQKLALMEILVVLATMLRHFAFTLAAKDSHIAMPQEETLTIHPKDLNVVVTLRNV